MIIRNFRELMNSYRNLSEGDIFIGQVIGLELKPAILMDLMQRGIRCIPSPLAQILNGSKAAQAHVLNEFMPSGTCVIGKRSELLEAVNRFNQAGFGPVVTKEDRLHCGRGILRWESMEQLYNQRAHLKSIYPFVLQPYIEKFTDIRVVVVDNYLEAYIRTNPHNFRKNLALGGKSTPCTLKKAQEAFCRAAMERGGFPYAHIDLMVTDKGEIYLLEMVLNGGIKGARIDRPALDRLKRQRLEALAEVNESKDIQVSCA